MKPIIFLNENTLGHSSYLPLFAAEFARHPEWGIAIEQIDVAPLPPAVEQSASDRLPGAMRLGLSAHYRRWREAASQHAAYLLSQSLAAHPNVRTVVVNTQSVGLNLPETLPANFSLLLCLDATFTQLRSTAWFSPNAPSRFFQDFTIGSLIDRERRLFDRAQLLLPWSQSVADSLIHDYGVNRQRIRLLPPSLPVRPITPRETKLDGSLPRLLFLGGDFQRKGGPLLVECFRRHFQGRAELDIVTRTASPEGPGVRVWKNISAWSSEWISLWRNADLFVFPSRLETFGIVLLEAHDFGVPIVSSRAGAADELLAGGQAGWLLKTLNDEFLRSAIQEALGAPDLRAAKSARGYALLEERFRLPNNARELATWIQETAPS
jgi:glycosyltransferase involved in cell wall biosynthesis